MRDEESGIRLVVFDLDGTLIDSRRDLADATNSLIEEYGGTPLSVEAVTAMVEGIAGVEGTFFGRRENEIVIDPIAVYRTL